jgi:mono/diheme cytochrome c family protein
MRGQVMAMSRAFLLAFAASASATAIVTSGEVIIAGRQAPAASVFTAVQTTAGKAQYAKHCASCHMPDLSGNGEISALAGPTFMETWGPRTTKDFLDYISAAMPYGQPSLTTEAYAEITAFILQSNGAVAGESALSASTAVPLGSLTAISVTSRAGP